MGTVIAVTIDLSSSWAFVDVETSGLDPRRDRVLSLAVVQLDPQLRVTGTFSTLLDPGVDPGPVHVHGLTREVLCGAPRIEAVAGALNELLVGRVMVAHNAAFDLGFLTQEALRAGLELAHTDVLDTLRMARSLGLGLPSLSLGSLALWAGVRQERAHDALDDTRVLVGVFRALHARALARGATVLALGERPVGARRPTGPAEGARWRSSARKVSCPYTNPGRWVEGSALVQGMRVAFSGDTTPGRDELEALTTAAGLDVTGSVSSRTSVLVCDSGVGTKADRAREVGCATITGAEYAELLGLVRPGTLVGDAPERGV